MRTWINGSENPITQNSDAQSEFVNSVAGSSLALDRGLAFGDGVFETMLVVSGRIGLISFHIDRLLQGLDALSISVPRKTLLADIELALQTISFEKASFVLKLIVNRGNSVGGYGYSDEVSPHRIMLLRDLPNEVQLKAGSSGVAVMFCETGLASQPLLSGIKHCNRLEQVLARREVDLAGKDEGLMLDIRGNVIEATASNIYIVEGRCLVTPPIVDCGVKGVVRQLLIQTLCDESNVEIKIEPISCARLIESEGVALSNAVLGLSIVDSCVSKDGRLIAWGANPHLLALQSRVKQLLMNRI